jgi:exopolyphosphatase/guanosine-5'-triphosphate,3'-diphosphate pyrophosphatase
VRLASMDVGTNSTRLLIADVSDGRITAQLTREMVITRLGKGVDKTRRFDPLALARTLEVLGDYAARCLEHQVEGVRLAATSATRDAANRDELIDGVRELLGIEPEVLSGPEEAAASFLGATWDLPIPPNGQVAVFDIGGGSTELIAGPAGAPVGEVLDNPPQAVSVDVGSVRLTERHVTHDPLTEDEVTAVRADAEAAIAAGVERLGWTPGAGAPGGAQVVGVAGTVTTVTALSLGLEAYDPDRVHRSTLTATTIAETAARLCAMTVAEKAALPIMPPGREDVIAAGALVLEAVCRVLALEEITVSETDILDGVLLGLARRMGA